MSLNIFGVIGSRFLNQVPTNTINGPKPYSNYKGPYSNSSPAGEVFPLGFQKGWSIMRTTSRV